MSWYRIQDADRDPQSLLDPAAWCSATWNVTQMACADCCGIGWLGYYSDDAEECGTCDGTGTITEQPRHGVSVCATRGDLAAYMEQASGDLRGTVLIELEGDVSDDDDFDAAAGAVLVLPSAIVSVTPITDVPEFAAQLAWDLAHR